MLGQGSRTFAACVEGMAQARPPCADDKTVLRNAAAAALKAERDSLRKHQTLDVPFTVGEVKMCLASLHHRKAVGLVGIPIKFLQYARPDGILATAAKALP